MRVRLTFSDWNFLTYPEIALVERPTFLPELLPHIDVTGGLCYFAPGSVVLDRYDPAMAIEQCLNQAQSLLDRIAADPSYRSNDIQEEFQAHWEFGQAEPPWSVLLGGIAPGAISADYFLIDIGGERRAIIASDPQEVAALVEAIGGGRHTPTRCKCWLFRTDIRPVVPHAMPNTVKELFSWLRQWDRALYKGMQRILEKEPGYLKFAFISFAVDTPIGWIGFGFDLDHMTRLGSQRKPRLYKQYLHGRGGAKRLLRLSISEIGTNFIHSRNLCFPDLRNKHLIIAGCGSIGSFLAQSLVRLGAGTGGGVLTLLDPDSVQPENIGRHLLGYPALFQPKAQALAGELSRQFPLSRIVPLVKSAFECPFLFTAELIIDATGEETVSEWLNGLRLDRKARVPMLHVWIKGNGESVQAIWTDDSGAGCYRCLRWTDHLHYRQERFPVLKKAPEHRFVGCHAFTPYAVSAPMRAAALASDMVSDWIKGDPSPRFRTRSIEGADVRKVKNQNISKLDGCPACGRP